MNPNKKVVFIWDFHGVLEKDNEYAVQYICKRVVREFGFSAKVYLRDVRRWYGLKWLEYFMFLTKEKNKEKLKNMVERAREVSREVVHKYLKPMDYARPVLAEIKKRGGTNIVISNSRQDRIEHFLKLVGLYKYADQIIGVDGHTRFSFNTAKEKARVMRKLTAGKGYSKKVVIGDSESDIKAGQMAGARTYLFFTRANRAKAKETNADRVISDLREVLAEMK